MLKVINKIIDSLIISCVLMIFISIMIAIWSSLLLGFKLALSSIVVAIALCFLQDEIDATYNDKRL